MSAPVATVVLLGAVAAMPAAAPSVVELIRAGDAGAAFLSLAKQLDEERVRSDDPGVGYAADILRYLRCADLRGPAGGEPKSLSEARRLFPLEKMRIERRRKDGAPSGPEAWIADGRVRWTLPPQDALDDKAIRWPAEAERWSDEQAVVEAPEVMCPRPPSASGPNAAPAPSPSPPTPALLTTEAEAMRTARLEMAPGSSVRAALIFDEAVLRARLGEWGEVWVLAKLLDEELARPGAGALTDEEEGERAILSALAAEQEERHEKALEHWDRASKIDLSDEEKLFVDVHRQRLLVDAGRLGAARALLDRYASLDGELGRYMKFRAALVRFRQGDEAGLLALARELLGGRPAAEVQAEPIGRAIEELVNLQLAGHAFDGALLEVVESLGPVDEVYRRAEALATVALDHGRAPLAAGLYRWLLDEHRVRYLRPYYLARSAVASASAGDAPAFAAAFHALVAGAMPKPGAARERAPRRGANKKSIEWDRQVLLATRDAVAALAARRDIASLRTLTTELQGYLRARQGPPPWPELTTLYRLASALLPSGPRAYAERVGGERAPVFLGAVALDRPREVVEPPALPLPRLVGPESLICLPEGSFAKSRCVRWLGPPQPPEPPASPPSPEPPGPNAPPPKSAEVDRAR